MKSFLFIFLFLFEITGAVVAQPTIPANVQHIQVKRLNDSLIDGYLLIKNPSKKLPLLVLCQGSGYDSNSAGFLGLAAHFGNQAVGLVLEKQGVKYGDKGDKLTVDYRDNNAIYNRVYDYLRVLQYLQSNATWWNGEIYVAGGSEGGLVAGMLASFYPNTKGVAIFCYGGGLTFGEAWPISSGLQKKSEGGNSEAINAAEKSVKDSLRYIRTNGTVAKSFDGPDNTYSWWASIMDLRLFNALIDLNMPIFVGQGTQDLMAPPISAKMLQQAFQAKGKTNLILKEYLGYNHGLADATGKSHLGEIFIEGISWMFGKNGVK